MIFLFLVGVEGTGHRMIRSLLADQLNEPSVVDEGAWHDLLIARWNQLSAVRSENSSLPKRDSELLRRELSRAFGEYRRHNITHLFDSSSFPYGQPRDAQRRPDILDFEELVAGFVTPKHLVLYRDPVSATYSAVRRGFTKDLHLQARIVECNLLYIAQQFQQLQANTYRVVHFEEFLKNPAHHVDRLADWWNLDRAVLERGLSNLRKPCELSQIPAPDRDCLTDFFTTARIDQWKDFFASNLL